MSDEAPSAPAPREPAKKRGRGRPRHNIDWRRFCVLMIEPLPNGKRRCASAAARELGLRPEHGYALLKRPEVKAYLAQLGYLAERVAERRVQRIVEKVVAVQEAETGVPAPPPVPPCVLDRDTDGLSSRMPQNGPMGRRVEASLKRVRRAIASRSEALRAASIILRTGRKRVKDIYTVRRLPSGESTLVSNAEAIGELPLASVKSIRHDAAGDLEIQLTDTLRAVQTLLEHYDRQEGGGDPMANARSVMNVLLFQGTPEDRAKLEALAMRLSELRAANEPGPKPALVEMMPEPEPAEEDHLE